MPSYLFGSSFPFDNSIISHYAHNLYFFRKCTRLLTQCLIYLLCYSTFLF
nr:MAG TPA: hypothetical protein [Bacteriophage sp.]